MSGDALLAKIRGGRATRDADAHSSIKGFLYKGPIARAPRKFAPQKLPKKLVDQLPFAWRPAKTPRGKRAGYLKQRRDASTGLAPRGRLSEKDAPRSCISFRDGARGKEAPQECCQKEEGRAGEGAREDRRLPGAHPPN